MSRDAAAVAKRVHRALDSFFHVESASTGEYRVHSGSGSTYTVTLPEGTCTCPDGQRGPWCKHAFRAAFQTGEVPDVEGVPQPDHANHESTGPRRARSAWTTAPKSPPRRRASRTVSADD